MCIFPPLRHGHIRLYDTKGHQRRPVLSMEWPDEVLTAISSTPCDHDVLVATATGHIAQFDIRMTHKGKEKSAKRLCLRLEGGKLHVFFTSEGNRTLSHRF